VGGGYARLVVTAQPYTWPITGPVEPTRVALVMIDMQHDFVSPGGWFSAMGFDMGAIEAVIPRAAELLAAARAVPGMHIVHTRLGNARDLSDLPPVRRERGERFGNPIGHKGPFGRGLIRGERGWDFIEEVAPLPGEQIVDKTGYSAFHRTHLEEWLQAWGIAALIFAGVTVNVCVLSTLLGAVDLG
jgi:nicotinamidase-related amidase